jgi:GR25 family glycosyltransferase involved in LPS biosynthesis
MSNDFVKIIQSYKVKIINFSNSNKSEINNIVNKIYVINLQENEIRRNYILVLMKKLNIDFTLVIVEKITNENYTIINKKSNISKSEAGCLLSHLWCLNDIIQNNHKNAIIFEDDIILHKNFKNMLIDKLKTSYDLLLLGACDFSFSQHNYKNIKNNVYNPSTFDKLYGAHANYYSFEGAKKMFELKTQNISFFDNNYNEIFDHFKTKSAICYPNLVVSDISTSDLGHSYNFLSLTEKHYYNKCFKNFKFNNYHFIYLNILKTSEINYNIFKNYEEYINNVLYNFFYDTEKVKIVKNRLDLSFYTIDDIKTILYKEELE